MALPDLPHASWIVVEEDAEGFPRVRLKLPTRMAGRWPAVVFAVACLVGAPVCGAIYFLDQLRQASNWIEGLYAVLSMLAGLVFGCVFAPFVGMLIWEPRSETITFRSGVLRHDRGSTLDSWAPFLAQRPDLNRFLQLLRELKQTVRDIRREEIGEIRLRRGDGWQQLSIDAQGKRIVVGRFLREPDREWLAQVLGAWARRPLLVDPPMEDGSRVEGPQAQHVPRKAIWPWNRMSAARRESSCGRGQRIGNG
ncbi:MAG: hypothetical protein HY000_24300 [Planctomycetes bacterium]|nr:hypothetical protein [Planctomycetota bacterium]